MENDELNQDIIVPEDENLENDEMDNLSEEDIPTVEDYQKALKQIATLKAQKEHFKKKATAVNQPKQESINKAENNNNTLSREEAILFAKGFEEEDIQLAAKIAKVNNVSMLEATKDEYFQSIVGKKQQELKSSKAQLGASNGSMPQPLGNLSEEQHREMAEKLMASL